MADRVVSKVMNNLYHLIYETKTMLLLSLDMAYIQSLASLERKGRKPFSLCMPMGVWRCGNTTKKGD
jgi:hypothetical protein